MPILPIVKYGDPVLERPAAPVERFDADLRALVADMIQTMYAAPGVGLAAPQVGVSLRVAVIDTTVGERPEELLVLVNPEIVASGGEQEAEEGCLSAPELVETVVRPERVEVRALDAAGREWRRAGEGLLARAFQHELDHLEGRLFVERLRGLKRTMLQRRLRRRAREGWA